LYRQEKFEQKYVSDDHQRDKVKRRQEVILSLIADQVRGPAVTQCHDQHSDESPVYRVKIDLRHERSQHLAVGQSQRKQLHSLNHENQGDNKDQNQKVAGVWDRQDYLADDLVD
jgi:hypothetical protein